MSVQALTWVLEHSQSEHSARLVAIALANHAGTDGGNSYPSIGTIAAEARLGESTVRSGIEQLKALGELVETGVSHLRTRMFAFPMKLTPTPAAEGADSGPPADSAGAQDLAAEGADSGPKPSTNQGERDLSAPAAAICGRVAAHVLSLDPHASVDETAPGWTDAAVALLDEGRTVDQVLEVVDWLTDEPFWSGRVLTPGDLRQHFGRLVGIRNGEAKPTRDAAHRDIERSERKRRERSERAGTCCAEAGGAPCDAEDEWKRIAPELRAAVGEDAFATWFATAHAHTDGDGHLLLGVAEVVIGMLRDRFAGALNTVAGRRLEIVTCEETTP